MKSLPTYDAVATELPNAGDVLKEEAGVLAELQTRLEGVQSEFETPEKADAELLEGGGLSAWQKVAVGYRLERKKLARSAAAILKVYERVLSDGG